MAEDQNDNGNGSGRKRGWLWLGLGLLAGAGIGGAVAWRKASNRYQPQTSGNLALPGLHNPVEVLRDRWGVPHIYAQDEHDLFYAQGFVQAQDRFWQMELNRRIGLGQLAAIFGRRALEVDRFTHRVGIPRAAAADLTALDADSAAVLEAYSAGVNAFIDQKRLPLELTILRYKPEPWRPLDTLAWVKMFAWALSANCDTELTRARLLKRLGSRIAAKLEPLYPQGHPLISPPGANYEGVAQQIMDIYQNYSFSPLLAEGGGSNNWVISGSRTATGQPLLANDPHLPLQIPSIWYEMHLHCPTFEAIGVTFPGAPSIAIGRNQQIAWGATAALTDLQDLFIEQFHPENPRQYLREGEWKDAEIVNIEIAVKGEAPHREEVLITEHGPVIAALPVSETGVDYNYKLSVQWVGYQPSNLLGCFLNLNRASNWQQFRDAFKDWVAPGFNMIYADRNGNIGYQLISHVPIRKTGGGTLPMPGWLKENDWQGTIPYQELPSIYNPPNGYIITANNRIAGNEYPYHLSSDYVNGYRAQRLQEIFENADRITVEDCRRAQADYISIPGRRFAALFLDRINPANLSPLAAQASREFIDWDGNADINSIAETLYQLTLHRLFEQVLGGLLGDDLHYYLGRSDLSGLAKLNSFVGRFVPFIINMIAQDDLSLLVELTTPQTWEWQLQTAFENAVADLAKRFGPSPRRWRWGRLHTAKFEHPLGAVPGLGSLFNRGTYPVPGDGDTPAQMAFPPLGTARTGFEVTGWAVSYRQIVDLADLNNSWMSHTTGQSGSPFSPHYDDMIKPWLKGDLHPMFTNRDLIEENCQAKLTLAPVPLSTPVIAPTVAKTVAAQSAKPESIKTTSAVDDSIDSELLSNSDNPATIELPMEALEEIDEGEENKAEQTEEQVNEQ